MKSQRIGLSRALVWVCVGTLILSGPGQTLALVAASGLDAPPAAAAVRSGRSADLAVTIDTRAYAGQRGRILMRLHADGAAPGAVTVRWTARPSLTGGVARSGERAVVAETAMMGDAIETVMTFEVESRGAADARIDVRPAFEFEGGDGQASPLTALGVDGAPLHVVLTPSLFTADAAADRWTVRSPENEPMPAGVQVTSGGVRLQRDFAATRVAFSPEFSDQYGFAFKGAIARAVSNRAAFGVVGGGGRSQSDLVANFGWQVNPSQRLLISGGSLQQDTDLAFDSGIERRGLRQASGGAAYSFMLGGRFQPRLDAQGYFASSPSQDLGSLQFFRESDGAAQIFSQDRRVAGALLTGAQTRASFAVLPLSTLTVSLGAERLRYAMATGDERTTTLTRGVEWAQQLSGGYAVQGVARTAAAMHTTGIGVERAFRAHGQRLGVTLTKIDGRNGVADDLQLRLTHTMAFGSGTRIAPQARVSGGVAETNPVMDALLNEVSQRPSFLPLISLAKVDNSRGAERLVAVDRAGMVPGTEVDEITGTVAVPTGASIITDVTRNGLAFSNTGQFSAAGGQLLIHAMAIEVPVGNDQYVVRMQRPDAGLTTVAIDVTHGSVHITRVSVMRGEADTTPDAFAFAAPPAAPVNSAVTSASVIIAGLGAAAPISITGGDYSLDGGPFTSTAGTIRDGQAVVVRVIAPAGYGATALGTVTIGGVSATFTVSSEAANGTPAAFAFSPRTAAELDTWIESDDVVVTGMNVAGAISISGGEYRLNGGAFTSAAGQISSGETVRVRVRSAPIAGTRSAATLSIGSLGVGFEATTAAAGADTTPDAFGFTAARDAARSTVITSAAATMAGMNTAAPISITGGEYSIDDGAFTSTAGTVSAGQSVRLRLTSAAGYNTTSSATVTIGGTSAAFSVTTAAEAGTPDTTPDAFSFTAETGAARSTVITSAAATMAGMNTAAAIAVTGGEYSIDDGAFTATAGTVSAGQSVRLRLTSAAGYNTTSSAAVTIGGFSTAFSVTTVAEAGAPDTTPDAFSFAAETGAARSTVVTSAAATMAGMTAAAPIAITGGEYSINDGPFTANAGTVSAGQSVRLRLTSAAGYNTTSSVAVAIGGISATFTVTTAAEPGAPDTTPDAFGFTTQNEVAVSTEVTSDSVTIDGLTASTSIASTGGEYSIDNGAFTAAAGTIANGQTVRVRFTTAASVGTSTTATLVVGGVTGTFTANTLGADTTPDGFAFTGQMLVAPGTVATSNTITVGGINTAAPISITGGEYRIDAGAYTSATATVTNGQTVTVRQTASAAWGTTTTATLNLGGVQSDFVVVTSAEPVDTTPDAFSFTAPTGVAVSTVATSNAITIAGINTTAAISIAGGTYSVNGGGYTSAAGTVTSGQTVTVQLTSSASAGTTTSAVLTVGGVTGSFDVTTAAAADRTPDTFGFNFVGGAEPGTTLTSETVTITGISAGTAISVSGTTGEYQVNGSGWTAAPGQVTGGDSVQVRHTAPAGHLTQRMTTLTVGTFSTLFYSQNRVVPNDTTPDAFTFTAQTGVAPNTVTTSNTFRVNGLSNAAAISITGGTYSIEAGAYTSAAGTVMHGQTVTVQLTSSASGNTTTSAVLTIGGVTGSFDVTTTAAVADTTPDAFSFTGQSDVPADSPITSNTITVSGINSPAAISITGGTYSVNAGGYTGVAGTVTNGQTVTVRMNSSTTRGATTSAVLTIGGVAGSFDVTTVSFDTTPNAFTFTAQTGVAVSTLTTSDTITVGGINGPAAISITGGEYRKNSGAYTSAAATVTVGSAVTVRLTSSATPGTTTSAVVTIGGVSSTFSVTTAAVVDSPPDPFSFTTQTGVAVSTVTTSNTITLGILSGAPAISVTGGEYRINSGAYTSAPGTVTNGQTVTVRLTSSASGDTTSRVFLTIGGVIGTFDVVTAAAVDNTPDAFSFPDETFGIIGLTYSSTTVTISGISAGTAISVSASLPATMNSRYRINGGAWTSAPGTINSGDTVRIQHNTQRTAIGSTTTSTLTIGTVSGTFTVHGAR